MNKFVSSIFKSISSSSSPVGSSFLTHYKDLDSFPYEPVPYLSTATNTDLIATDWIVQEDDHFNDSFSPLFKIRNGNLKKDPERRITWFEFSPVPEIKSSHSVYRDGKNDSNDLQMMSNLYLKRLKSIRHPRILSAIDYFDCSEKIIFVTEPIIPLYQYLNIWKVQLSENKSKSIMEDILISGIYQILTGCEFLISKAKLSYRHLNLNYVVVESWTGQWKLCNLDQLEPIDEASQQTQMFIELGKLIQSIFDYVSCQISEPALRQLVQNLLKSKIDLNTGPPSLDASIMHLLSISSHSKNPSWIQVMLWLDELPIADPSSKAQFIYCLRDYLIPNTPLAFHTSRVLTYPLLGAFQSSLLVNPPDYIGPILQLAQSHPSAYLFQKNMIPWIIDLWTGKNLTNKGFSGHAPSAQADNWNEMARVKCLILQSIPSYQHLISEAIFTECFYAFIKAGWKDPSPWIREWSLRCIMECLPLFQDPKLLKSDFIKNGILIKMLSTDPYPVNRVNALVAIGKLISLKKKNMSRLWSTPQDKWSLLVDGLQRALRDPFPPCRLTALNLLQVTLSRIPEIDLTSKIMPLVCPMAANFIPSKKIDGLDRSLGPTSGGDGVAEETSQESIVIETSQLARIILRLSLDRLDNNLPVDSMTLDSEKLEDSETDASSTSPSMWGQKFWPLDWTPSLDTISGKITNMMTEWIATTATSPRTDQNAEKTDENLTYSSQMSHQERQNQLSSNQTLSSTTVYSVPVTDVAIPAALEKQKAVVSSRKVNGHPLSLKKVHGFQTLSSQKNVSTAGSVNKHSATHHSNNNVNGTDAAGVDGWEQNFDFEFDKDESSEYEEVSNTEESFKTSYSDAFRSDKIHHSSSDYPIEHQTRRDIEVAPNVDDPWAENY